MTAWLIDTLLYTGLLIALVLVLRRPAGQVFGPQIAYALWALPMVRLLLPPIVLPAWLAPEPDSVAVNAVPVKFAIPAAPVEPVAVPEGGWDVAAVLAELPTIALVLWLAGAAGFLLWRIAGYRRMRAELLAEARPVGEVGRIRLVETPAVSSPVAFGVRDKVVALPQLFMAQPDREGRDLAIAHELEHHRGHDLLANFAAQALLALHWFNPLAWLGWRAMRRDQEAACDARVMAGRSRSERALYAELIAGIAAGVRPAGFGESLAAPMACPVLGETSIIHRLRSLSMSDITPRRRRLGHGLIAGAALVLPLTASISYAAGAQAPELPQPPEPPAPPAPPSAAAIAVPQAPAAPQPPAPPLPPEAPLPAGEPQTYRYTVSHDGEGPEGERHVQLSYTANPLDPNFEAEMEAFAEEMERFAEQWAAYGEAERARAVAQGEAQRARAQAYADGTRARAMAGAAAAQAAPEVVMSCDEGEQTRTMTADGRRRIVICQRRYMSAARQGLLTARAAIAGNTAMDPTVRDEVLRNLDSEIRRIEREG